MSLYPISRNALASGSPKKPWASAQRLMTVGKFSSAARLAGENGDNGGRYTSPFPLFPPVQILRVLSPKLTPDCGV